MKLKIGGIEREYREVKRKAAAGELIKITYDGFGSGACDGDYFKVGNIARVKIMGDDDVIADFKGLGNAYVYNSGTWHVNHSAYVVLEPVETEIDSLVSELSRRIDEIIEEVSNLKAQVRALSNVKKPALTRGEIVERAKKDVKRVIDTLADEDLSVRFRVNKDRRVVVCEIIDNVTGRKESKGYAKCAPDDVFNVHIGKVIAAFRAAGWPMLDEYLNAPQPTEPRVGDIVQTVHGPKPVYAVRPTHRTVGVILDDSREEVTK